MSSVFLAQQIDIGGTTLQGPLDSHLVSVSDVINRVLLFVVPFAGILLFFALVFGGYSILMSQGNPEKLKNGKNIITAALIGFIILTLSFFFVKLIGFLLGLNKGSTPFF